ncbi:putative amino acid transporter [Gordonia effusa NBRC 100432]|uniref:Putative amino acid transporter n=1 Tax=Gordonia effusa NBRC 100432 TaxID=1077974 RepID=H0R5P6_9ACTN|nr:LysE family transporter [Gordonia effusa]GAB20397.1 putative amino acid transporter [Gordonia effusa NBRC 100432]
MLNALISGLLLGYALIIPIGSQNILVLTESIRLGLPKSLVVAATAAICDSILIILGAVGASRLLASMPAVRVALLFAGAAFLLYLGVRAIRAKVPAGMGESPHLPEGRGGSRPLKSTVIAVVGASLINPHAILDTVGVIGLAIASQPGDAALWFALGTLCASATWFGAISVIAGVLADKITPVVRMWIDRISGVILIGFAVFLFTEGLAAA